MKKISLILAIVMICALVVPVLAQEVTVTDVLGREVTLPKPATKVVGTHNPSMNLAIVLGGGGKYVAGFGNKKMANGLYDFVFPELANDVVQIGKGKDINFETVASLKPDLAILPERFANQAEQYEAIGVPAVVALPSTESFETITNALTMVGTLLGEDERAAEIVSMFDEKIAKGSEIAAAASEKPSILFLGSSDIHTVASDALIQSIIMEAAGGVNAATGLDVSGDFAEVNMEQIISWNPDVIWVPVYADYTVDDVLKGEEWAQINAVKNGKVYQFPSALEPWDYPTASSVLGLSWAMYNLHPDLYSFDELMKDVDDYYNFIYGQTFTAEQLGIQ